MARGKLAPGRASAETPLVAVLEEIVREELRPLLEPIIRRAIRELVAEQLNGDGPAPDSKTCNVCHETKPASEYERGRQPASVAAVRRSENARRGRALPPPTRSIPTPRRRRGRGYQRFPKGPLLQRLDQERREQIEAAPITFEQRDGRTWLVRRLPSYG
jgi:hypothetical protein